eukprot:jgi/Tetstr1/439098/TSEL_002963.t1
MESERAALALRDRVAALLDRLGIRENPDNAAGLVLEEWNPVTTIGHGKTNDNSIKQIFDAGQGNMVITDMSEHHENITEAERRDLLDDWEAKLSVGKIRKHKDPKDPNESKMG